MIFISSLMTDAKYILLGGVIGAAAMWILARLRRPERRTFQGITMILPGVLPEPVRIIDDVSQALLGIHRTGPITADDYELVNGVVVPNLDNGISMFAPLQVGMHGALTLEHLKKDADACRRLVSVPPNCLLLCRLSRNISRCHALQELWARRRQV